MSMLAVDKPDIFTDFSSSFSWASLSFDVTSITGDLGVRYGAQSNATDAQATRRRQLSEGSTGGAEIYLASLGQSAENLFVGTVCSQLAMLVLICFLHINLLALVKLVFSKHEHGKVIVTKVFAKLAFPKFEIGQLNAMSEGLSQVSMIVLVTPTAWYYKLAAVSCMLLMYGFYALCAFNLRRLVKAGKLDFASHRKRDAVKGLTSSGYNLAGSLQRQVDMKAELQHEEKALDLRKRVIAATALQALVRGRQERKHDSKSGPQQVRYSNSAPLPPPSVSPRQQPALHSSVPSGMVGHASDFTHGLSKLALGTPKTKGRLHVQLAETAYVRDGKARRASLLSHTARFEGAVQQADKVMRASGAWKTKPAVESFDGGYSELFAGYDGRNYLYFLWEVIEQLLRVCALILVSSRHQPNAVLAVAFLSWGMVLWRRPYNGHEATRTAIITKTSQTLSMFALVGIRWGVMDTGTLSVIALFSSQIMLYYIIACQAIGMVTGLIKKVTKKIAAVRTKISKAKEQYALAKKGRANVKAKLEKVARSCGTGTGAAAVMQTSTSITQHTEQELSA